LLNVATVVVGGTVGTLLGERLPERVRSTVMQALGLVTLALGIKEAIATRNILLVLGCLLVGALIGEALVLEDRLDALGEWARRRFVKSGDGSTFAEGFVLASLVFCVGPLTVLGSIRDGLKGDISLLAVKSTLDGFAALAFSASLGWGVVLAAVTVAVYQGALTAFAHLADNVLSARMILEMTATGGLMVMAIGLRLLDIARIRIASMLPALVLAPLAVAVFAR
jgi:uncharacterized membrane protein YqgA involved in biofilm formation